MTFLEAGQAPLLSATRDAATHRNRAFAWFVRRAPFVFSGSYRLGAGRPRCSCRLVSFPSRPFGRAAQQLPFEKEILYDAFWV